MCTVASAAAATASMQATAAPSRADSSEIARPLPTGTLSPGGVGRWPAPTTTTLRPDKRPRPRRAAECLVEHRLVRVDFGGSEIHGVPLM